jgi:hypothetical protein
MSTVVFPSRARHALRRKQLSRTRRLSASGLAVVGFSAMFWAALGGVAFQSSAQAATSSVNQCNGIATTAGLEVTCDANVVNHLNLATGAKSSTVTLTVCQGAANATPTCATPTTTSYTGLTTSVTQCNGSVEGGGGVIICSVHVANVITGNATTTAATVNQCNGSGQGGGVAMICNPTASTTNATITQCNMSGNGGAGVSVTCSVTPSTRTSALPVTVNQCIGSGNGGGSVVTCSTSLTNQVIPAVAPTTTAPGKGSSTGSGSGGSGHGSGSGGSGSGGSSGSKAGTHVIGAPVLAPPLQGSHSSFTPPAGLTGDSAPPARHADPLLWVLAIGSLTAGLVLMVVRSPR